MGPSADPTVLSAEDMQLQELMNDIVHSLVPDFPDFEEMDESDGK